MALIRCPECGHQVSDFASSCPNCGYPLQKNRSELTVYGLTQSVIGGTITLFLDGAQVAKVGKGEKVTIPINRTCRLTARCGINPLKGECIVRYGKSTVIRIIYNRLSGGFILSEE